jgi:plastocyanin
MNNADETLTREEEIKRAKGQVRGLRSHGAWLSEELGIPHLKPIFPENPGQDPIEDTHEISMLDRSAMLLESTDLDRVDLQLLRMADHARETILANELANQDQSTLHEKFVMYGNSSEGASAERMAAMHPEEILAIAAAGLNGMALLPLEVLGGRTLNYHVGIADLESIIGNSYNAVAHDDVNLFLIQGGADSRNRLMMDKEEALRRNNWKGFEELYLTARETFGPRMVEDRFPRGHIAFEHAGVSAQFRVVPGMPHDDSMALHEIREFLHRSIQGEDVSGFGQRFRLPFDRTIDLHTSNPSVGDTLQFEISGEHPPPEGLVTYDWGVDDGRSSSGTSAEFTIEESGDYEVTLSLETAHGQSGRLGMSLLGDGSSFAALQYAVDVPGPRHLATSTEFLVGESIPIEVEVTNVGAVSGERTLEFLVDSEARSSQQVDLDPSSSTTVTFSHTFAEQGEVEIRIPPAFKEAFTVNPNEPEFVLREVDLSTTETVVGQPITVRATVKNGGTGPGELPVTLRANGEVIATTSVTLEVDETEAVSFEHVFEEPGSYDLEMNDRSMGTISVEPEPTATPEFTGAPGDTKSRTESKPTATEAPGQPGFGIISTLAGLGSTIGYLVYRTGDEDQR